MTVGSNSISGGRPDSSPRRPSAGWPRPVSTAIRHRTCAVPDLATP